MRDIGEEGEAVCKKIESQVEQKEVGKGKKRLGDGESPLVSYGSDPKEFTARQSMSVWGKKGEEEGVKGHGGLLV